MTPVHRWRCPDCESVAEVPPDEPPPPCGHLHTDDNEFPDGSWVQIRTYTVHQPRLFVGVFDDNPLHDIVDEQRDLADDAPAPEPAQVGGADDDR